MRARLSLYFDELLIEHPFIHPRTVNKEFSPLEHPKTYRQEFLKSVVLFMAIMPLVEQGLVTLFPDPCNFDFHLRDQTFQMARFRSQAMKFDPKDEAGVMEMMKEDHKRSMLLLPREALRHQFLRASPELDEKALEAALDGFDIIRQRDPLAVFERGRSKAGRRRTIQPLKMAQTSRSRCTSRRPPAHGLSPTAYSVGEN